MFRQSKIWAEPGQVEAIRLVRVSHYGLSIHIRGVASTGHNRVLERGQIIDARRRFALGAAAIAACIHKLPARVEADRSHHQNRSTYIQRTMHYALGITAAGGEE